MGKSIAVFIALSLSACTAFGYSGGSGTVEDPYQLAEGMDVFRLAGAPSDWDKHFVFTADIDLGPIGWDGVLIGQFSGTLDGNGHSLTSVEALGGSETGLIRELASGGVVRNLNIVDATIYGSHNAGFIVRSQGAISNCHISGNVLGRIGVGGLVGNNAGVILDSSNSATVEGVCWVGGLASGNSGRIIRCHNTGDVAGAVDTQWRFVELAGGLLSSNSGTVVDCFSTSKVSGDGEVGGLIGGNKGVVIRCYTTGRVSGGYEIGGLVGENRGWVVHSYSTASATGDFYFMGGLVGYNDEGIVTQCYSTGVVADYSGGGLVGYNRDGFVSGSFWDVETSKCDNSEGGTGLSTAEMMRIETYLEAGWDFVGERANGLHESWQMPEGQGYPVPAVFLGYAPRSLSGDGTEASPYQLACPEDLGAVAYYSDAAWYELTSAIDLSGITWRLPLWPSFSGVLDGRGHAIAGLTLRGGGVLGLIGTIEAEGSVLDLGVTDANVTGIGDRVGLLAGTNEGTVSQCHAAGIVTGDTYVAGLVGYNSEATLDRCCSTATVNGVSRVGGLAGRNAGGEIRYGYNTGRVTGQDYVGGLVGDHFSGAILQSYAAGWVTGQTNVGGLVGYNNMGQITQCVWDTAATGQDVSPGGTGLVTVQMMDPEYLGLNGWAGSPHWLLDAGRDYPHLAWEGTPGQPIPVPTLDWIAGNGTVELPYGVTGAEQLVKIGHASVFWDKSLHLGADIDLAGIIWPRSILPEFQGLLDGNGFAISNLTISGKNNLGLVGTLHAGAEVRDVSVVEACITGTDSAVGILVGRNEGVIRDARGSGLSQGKDDVGGLVGLNDGGLISRSSSDAVVRGSLNVGGLVGQNEQGHVAQCFSTSDVNGIERVGGLIGLNETSLVGNSFAEAFVYGANEAGGLIGNNAGLVLNSYAAGVAFGDGVVGGLAGAQSSSSMSLAVGSFWDTDVSVCLSSAGGQGVTTAQMQECALYSDQGWSISLEDVASDSLWKLPDVRDYPYLAWQAGPNDRELSEFSGGSGTADNPFLLATAEDLRAISENPDLMDRYFHLVNDLDLAGVDVPMIGLGVVPFRGTLDGGDHTIANFTCHRDDHDFVGFFSIIGRQGQVKNLTLTDVDVAGHDYVGGLAGHSEGHLTNCRVTGRVSGNNVVGGLVGWNWVREETCQAEVEVTGNDDVGDVVGSYWSPSHPTSRR